MIWSRFVVLRLSRYTGIVGTMILLALGAVTAASAANRNGEAGETLPIWSLSTLEKRLADPDELLIAAADLEAAAARLAQQRTKQGTKLFAGVGGGLSNDTSLDSDDQRYSTYDLRAGVRYPLLGRANAEQRDVVEAETAVLEKEQRLELARRQSLSLLRRSYVLYWSAQEKLRLTQAFLAGEPGQVKLLAHRQQSGYLLESDRLEFHSAFDLARRNQHNLVAASQTALLTIQRLVTISSAFNAAPPDGLVLPVEAAALPRLARENHPSVVLLAKRLQGLEQQIPLARHADTNAHVDLYTAAGVDDAQKHPEYSINLSFSVELPLKGLAQGENHAQQSAQALASKCRRELALERFAVGARVEEALALYRAAEADVAFAVQRLQAAAIRVRENRLRTAMEGDSLERLQQSRFTYYQACIDAVDAQVRQWNALIELVEYAGSRGDGDQGEGKASTASVTDRIDLGLLRGSDGTETRGTAPARKTAAQPSSLSTVFPDGTSLYVWKTAQFQALSQSDPAFVDRLRAAEVRRVLLSLDQQQIDALADPGERARFSSWLNRLRGQGIKAELLLGEPLWILPEHRPKLLAIVSSLATLPFTGLHLDIEPDQLERLHREAPGMLAEWIATLEAARRISPWPLGVSVHPRYVQADQKGADIVLEFERLGISEVVLMVYISNPERVAQVVGPILKRAPQLKFSVAQSVEPELSLEESHYQVGRKAFADRMARLAPLIDAPNLSGLVVQDWNRLQEMQP